MAADNSIELFNCSLCSFCETSLDRLVKHIRQHIKPEPEQHKNTAPNEVNNVVSSENQMTSSVNEMTSFIDNEARSSGFYEKHMRLMNDERYSLENNDCEKLLSPKIEITNPHSLSVANNMKNFVVSEVVDNEELNYPPPLLLGQCGPPPLLLEGSILQSSYQSYEPSTTERHKQRHVTTERHKQQKHVQNTTLFNPPMQGNFRSEAKEIILDNRQNENPVSRSNFGTPPKMPVSDQYAISAANQSRSRKSSRGTTSIDLFRMNLAAAERNNKSNKQYTQNNNETVNKFLPENSLDVRPPNRLMTSNKINQNNNPSVYCNKPDVANSQKNVNNVHNLNSRLNYVKSDLLSKKFPPFSLPNNANVVVNPDQLLSVTSNLSLDQLAGVLVIPLKKTLDIATQTNFVNVSSFQQVKNMSCYVQTELKMSQVCESDTASYRASPLFNHVRSIDYLIECKTCADEFQTQDQLKVHVSEKHTITCPICSFRTIDLNQYSIHKEECESNAEMLCMECNNSFTTVRKLNLHRQLLHDIAMPFKCAICNAPFEEHDDVMKHILSHDMNVTSYKCRYCIRIFETYEALDIHVSKHKAVDVLYECRFCHLTFNSDKLLKDHVGCIHVISNHVPEESHVIPEKSAHIMINEENNALRKPCLCKHCDLAFKNKLLLKKHLMICSKNSEVTFTEYHCDVCKEFFDNEQLKKEHVQADHKRSNGYRCPKCSKVYRTWSRLKFHTKQQHSKKICGECSLVFTKEHVLRKHQEDIHGKALTQPGERVYTCSICNTMLFTLTDLMTHRKVNHAEIVQNKVAEKNSTLSSPSMTNIKDNRSPMPLDSESFHTELETKTSHDILIINNDFIADSIIESNSPEMTVNEENILSVQKCPECNSIFTSKHALHEHMESIHDMKQESGQENIETSTELISKKNESSNDNLCCRICDIHFRDTKRLKNHLGLIHGEKPFSCDLCHRKFQYSSQVIWHMRHHRKVQGIGGGIKSISKSIKLTSLRKKFSTSVGTSTSVANSHYFGCQYCGLRFKKEKLLKNHKGLAHRIKLYTCEICNTKFGHSTELIWHSRTCRAKYKRNHPELEFATIEMEQKFDMGHDYLPSDKVVYQDYKCHICEASFHQLEEYQEHMSSHVGKEIKGPLTNKDTSTKTRPATFDNNLPSMIPINGSYEPNLNKSEYSSIANERSINIISNEQTNIHSNNNDANLYHGNALEILKEEPVYDVSISEYMCPICHKTTKSVTGMKTHYGRVHGVWSKETTHKDDHVEMKIWQCKHCEREFGHYQNLLDHTQSIHGIVITENEAEFNVRYKLRKANEEQTYNYSCPHCQVTFDNSKAIRVHTFKKHGTLLNESDLLLWRTKTNENEVSNNESDAEHVRYQCERCSAKFHTVKAIRVHSFKRHGFVLSKREVIASKSSIPKSFFAKVPHNRNRGKDLVEEPNPCDQCSRVFGNYRALFTHRRQAHRMFNATKIPKKPSRTELSSSYTPSNESSSMSPPLSSPTMTIPYPAHDEVTSPLTNQFPPSFLDYIPNDLLTETPQTDVEFPPSQSDKMIDEASSKPLHVPTIECPKCDRIFTQRKSLVTHMFSAHRITKDQYHIYWPNGMPELPRKSSTCSTCGKVCIDERAVRIHIFKAHGIRYQDMINQGLNGTDNPDAKHIPSKTDESELRYVEDNNGPPVCFICGRLFKGKKSLMIHEFKVHGIKWSGKKRIFPSKVRNLPKFGGNNKVHKKTKTSVPRMVNNQTKIVVNEQNGFVCPVCNAFYANRRAITTHLCRIHHYSRERLHSYFDGLNGFTNQTFDRNLNALVSYDTTQTDEHKVTLIDSIDTDYLTIENSNQIENFKPIENSELTVPYENNEFDSTSCIVSKPSVYIDNINNKIVSQTSSNTEKTHNNYVSQTSSNTENIHYNSVVYSQNDNYHCNGYVDTENISYANGDTKRNDNFENKNIDSNTNIIDKSYVATTHDSYDEEPIKPREGLTHRNFVLDHTNNGSDVIDNNGLVIDSLNGKEFSMGESDTINPYAHNAGSIFI